MALGTKAEAKKAKKKASKAVEAAGASSQNAQKAVEELQKLAAQVGPVVSEGAREARSKATDLYGQYVPEAQQKLREQGDKLSQNLGPRADKRRHALAADHPPRARKAAGATGTVPKAAVDAAR